RASSRRSSSAHAGGHLLLADVDVAAEGFDPHIAVAIARRRVEAAAGTVVGFGDAAEIAADAAAEARGGQSRRDVGGQVQVHVAAHRFHFHAHAAAGAPAQADVAGHGARADLAVTGAFGVDVAGHGFQFHLAGEAARTDVARHAFQVRARGVAGEVDVAADAVDIDFARAAVEAQVAAHRVD